MADSNLTELTANIVSNYVGANNVSAEQLPELIRLTYHALADVASGVPSGEPAPEPQKPAVPVKKSVTPDFLISLEDGRRYKSLKRHLRTQYNMSPEDYRAKWGLPKDYPMVSPNYAASRSAMARERGLGRGRVQPKPATKPGRKPRPGPPGTSGE